MERQHVIFIAATTVVFSALVVIGLFNPFQKIGIKNDDSDIVKAKIGGRVDIRYSSNVIGMIEKLPSKNNLTLEVSSELHNTNLAGLNGEIRYSDEIISFVQKGKEEVVEGNAFKNIEYRFFPDAGNKTRYTYENVKFMSTGDNSQLIASFKPLSTANVGDKYVVKMILDTGGIIKYNIGEKTIEIVP